MELGATAFRFRAGRRIRLQVTSSCFPTYDRNLNTGGDNVTEAAGLVAVNTVHFGGAFPSSLEFDQPMEPRVRSGVELDRWLR